MGSSGWLIRHRLRRQWLAMVPLFLIVASGTGGAIVALGAAQRTDTAFADYLDRADVGDLVINPGLNTAEISRVIHDLPGVTAVTSDALLTVSLDPDDPAADEGDPGIQVRGSADGRYTAMDRPVVRDGRLPTGTEEIFASVELAEAQGTSVGDVVPLAFWNVAEVDRREPGDVISPIGVEDLTVVGIGTFSDEVLPDRLYTRQKAIVSADVADRYDCFPETPPADITLDEAFAALIPADCSTSYQYYSLEIEGGAAGLAAAQAAFVRKAEALSADLPLSAIEDGARYILIGSSTDEEQARVERSTQPTVAALAVLGLFTAVVTVLLTGIAVVRELRSSDRDQLEWWRLGLTVGERAAVVVVPMFVAVLVGLVVATVLGWLLSPLGPVGSVRVVDQSPGRGLSPWSGLGAAAMTVALLATVVLGSWVWARRLAGGRTRARRPSRLVRLASSTNARPDVSEGIRAAFEGRRGAGVVVGSGIVAAAVFTTAVVFGTSLSALISTPRSYGWPWDVGVTGNYGYGPIDVEQVSATLDGRDDVTSWTGLGFTNSITIDDEPVFAVVSLDDDSTVDFAVAEGRLPGGSDEVAVGARTAREQGIHVGDKVELVGDDIEARTVTVAGIAVLPSLGPFESERAGPGTGILVPGSVLDPGYAQQLAGFVGVETRSGADPGAVLRDVTPHLDAVGYADAADYAREYREPIRPPEIADADSMRRVPLVVGGLLVLATVVGLSIAVAVSVRSRRRELATLRTLGFTGRQLRRSVHVQVVATVVAALVVGIPAGMVIGRVAWRTFASELGVATDPSTPIRWIVGTVIGALVVALLAAAFPARVAARTTPAEALRSE